MVRRRLENGEWAKQQTGEQEGERKRGREERVGEGKREGAKQCLRIDDPSKPPLSASLAEVTRPIRSAFSRLGRPKLRFTQRVEAPCGYRQVSSR